MRPKRVVALAVLLVFGGLLTLGLAGAGAGPYEGLPSWMSALLSVPYLVLAWAVWHAKRWAWWTLLALHGVTAAVLVLVAGSAADTTAASLDLLWPAAYLVLLASERTRAWFAVTVGRDAHRS